MILIEEVKRQGQLIGVVVAIGKGKVGYSICHPIERTNNFGRAVEIAVGRARKRSDSIKRLGNLVNRFEEEIQRQEKRTVTHRYGRDKEIHDARDRVALVLNKLVVMGQLSLSTKWSKL